MKKIRYIYDSFENPLLSETELCEIEAMPFLPDDSDDVVHTLTTGRQIRQFIKQRGKAIKDGFTMEIDT